MNVIDYLIYRLRDLKEIIKKWIKKNNVDRDIQNKVDELLDKNDGDNTDLL